MTFAASPFAASAQDDLDDLLKQLDGESSAEAAEPATAEEEASTKEANVAEKPAEEEAPAEAKKPAAESAADEPDEPSASATDEPDEPEASATDEPDEPEAKSGEEVATSTAATPSSSAADKPQAQSDADPAPAEASPEEVNQKVDDVLSLLDALDSEASAEPAAEAPASAEPAAAEAAPSSSSTAAGKPDKPQPTAAGKPGKPKAKPGAAAASSKSRPKRVGPDAELIENLVQTERLRRDSYDEQAKREIVLARGCMESKDFQEAVRHYGLALKLLNDSRLSRDFRRECESGIAEGLYRAALQEDSIGRRAKARELMEKALEMRHPKARRVLEKWQSESTVDFSKTDFSEVSQRSNESDYKADRETARRHLRRARQYLALRDIPRALNECEIVLKTNPNNQEAIRLRDAIQAKRQVIHEQTREAARKGMIADVDDAWRPVYAVNAGLMLDSASETVKSRAGEDPERTQEQDIVRRMREMRLPTIEFKPPATIIEAIDFFRTASRDYDRPDVPIEKRGFNFVLRTPVGAIKQQAAEESADDFSAAATEEAGTASGLPPIPKITASDISFYDALKLVCDSVDYKFIVSGPVIMVMQKDMSTAELISRKYNVPEAFVERVNTASEEIKEMGGFGSNNRSAKRASSDEEGSADRDWKAFFEEMGVKWPEGSSIKHIKALGKLYVRNTSENLAEFEKVIDELGGQPQLIEIETRFVEVSQEDLNSLGFEWILNSDYSLDLTRFGRKVLGLKNSGPYGSASVGTSDGSSSSGSLTSGGKTSAGGTTSGTIPGSGGSSSDSGSSSPISPSSTTTTRYRRSMQMAKIQGTKDFSDTSNISDVYSNGNRYLSTTGNHISGDSNAYNDQFMRVNAFLGQADLSMILHMLSQRSDTDLLSAPKVVTKSGEQAVIKVVTEYIYPQDYNVQLQSSSSSSGSSSSSSQSAILAVVEPQNFTMREVGVILDVLPTYSEANGGTIDLELKPSVVDEPTWKNYGMSIPFTGNASALQSFEGLAEIPVSAVNAILALGGTLTDSDIKSYQDAIMSASMSAMNSSGGSDTMTWYDAPMEQPFFHVRSIESKVSITPGATVVMGGLITEQRKAMDDKVPFLGDLPFIGRLFRSHAEQTIKRNLLIFVTGRLITPSGRELTVNGVPESEAEVKPAPKAE